MLYSLDMVLETIVTGLANHQLKFHGYLLINVILLTLLMPSAITGWFDKYDNFN